MHVLIVLVFVVHSFAVSGIPIGVVCDPVSVCWNFSSPFFEQVCLEVCARGSVKIRPWVLEGARLQGQLAQEATLCYANLIGSHNSAITAADGYGVLDHVLTSYIQHVFPTSFVRTNNQWLSLTDQLEMGVRMLELDIHYVLGELRIAHCGFKSFSVIDDFIHLLDDVARMLHRPPIPWDSLDLGCLPSGSGLPAHNQRAARDAFHEIASWLSNANNANEFLMLYIDDEPDMQTFNKTRLLVQEAKNAFGPLLARVSLWNASLPIRSQVGRPRVIIVSRFDFFGAGDDVLFYRPTLCNWTEPDGSEGDWKSCRINGTRTESGVFFRLETAQLSYGPLAGGTDTWQLDEEHLVETTQCSINVASPDSMVPQLIEPQLWTLTSSSLYHDSNSSSYQCALLTHDHLPYWTLTNDTQLCTSTPKVCYDNNNPVGARVNSLHWKLASSDCTPTSPINALENSALVRSLSKIQNFSACVVYERKL